jgi:hypothetical protein
MHLKLKALVKGSTTLFLAACGVVRHCFSSSDNFRKEREKEVMNLPSKNVQRLPGNLKEFQSTPSHDGNISSIDFCIARKMSTRAVVTKK